MPLLKRLGVTDTVSLDRHGQRALDPRLRDATLRERAKTLNELAEQSLFYFKRPEYTDPARDKLFTTDGARRLDVLIPRLEAVTDFTAAALEHTYRELAAELGVKLGDIAQLTRFAVTGRTASPPLFDVLELLGKPESLARLRAARASIGEGRR